MVIDIDQMISKASAKIGVDEPTTRRCIGAILAFLQQHHGSFDFSVIMKIDGVDKLIKEAQDDDEIPDIPKPAPGIPSSQSEGASPAAGSPPVATTTVSTSSKTATSTSTASSIFNVIVAIMKMFGLFAILKQILSSIFGDSAVKLIESIEDGAELTHVLSSLKISRDQGIRLVRMVVDFLKEKLDSDTIDQLVDQVPAIKIFLGESKKEE
mmetsp:Transcript_5342/g.11675  ORF Transcript_5342/g.11675 Transcript_5342/m.11675 type:complete len:211 (+) Transcript_5342:168-800(+)|eukprot:CAMPEP_0178591786 /NCGR_PEP_ID=MMETSP0697-20121206/28989_1 /TAXON_ID=265572 /ORGANISM="Extubocellulus spinifer, Strain CCMP396" /LENGTH=210 /DNA_ID=CAMNT_0020228699 /DNA_START=82 /DNA_END=714 /DNA_ORIENTATION=+